MRTFLRIVLAATLSSFLGTGAAHYVVADDREEVPIAGYLPLPCTEGPHQLPDWFQCPTPYVELVPVETDAVFERAWHCRETGHSLGLVRGGDGCGGWKELFEGWSLQPSVTVLAGDLQEEITTHVIDPCFLQGIKDQELDEMLGEDEALELFKVMQAKQIEQLIDIVEPLVIQKEISVRQAVYKMALSQCIQGMRSGN